jgi:hypothetical protein
MVWNFAASFCLTCGGQADDPLVSNRLFPPGHPEHCLSATQVTGRMMHKRKVLALGAKRLMPKRSLLKHLVVGKRGIKVDSEQ